MKTTIYSEPINKAVLANGRVYFSPADSDFFPSDSFGDRNTETGGLKGKPVQILAGADTLLCDIRRISANRIGPRSSFKTWLKLAGIREGDVLQLTGTGDRTYRLERKAY